MTERDTTKAAARYMLKHGLANYSDIAQLSKWSKQIVRHWAKEYPDARAEFLAKQWEKAVKAVSKRA